MTNSELVSPKAFLCTSILPTSLLPNDFRRRRAVADGQRAGFLDLGCLARMWRRWVVAAVALLVLAACRDSPPTAPVEPEPSAPLEFLDGTADDPQIGMVINSLARTLGLFRLGEPGNRREIALGASSAVTPVGFSVRGETAVAPLGNAASVAVIDLRARRIDAFFRFESGNATGSAIVGDGVALAANQETDQVGRFALGGAGGPIGDLVAVAPFPTRIVTANDSLALVISANLDDSYQPVGDGVVTALDPRTMTVAGTVGTGGTNPQYGALGPDGMLYVANTGDYVVPASVAVIDPGSLELVALLEGFPAGSGHLHLSGDGILFASAFFAGTVAWDTAAGRFVRDSSDPICAPLADGSCRGAFAAHTAADGSLYQTFFGSAAMDLPPRIFRYDAGTFALADSVEVGQGPVGLEIRSFR